MKTHDDIKSDTNPTDGENEEILVFDDQINALASITEFGFPWTPMAINMLKTVSLIRERFFQNDGKPSDTTDEEDENEVKKQNPIYHEVCENYRLSDPGNPFSKLKSLSVDYRIFNRTTKTVLSIRMDSKKKSLLHCEMYRVMAAGDAKDGNNRVPLFSKDVRFTQKTIGKTLNDLVSTWKEKDAESDVEENAMDSLIGEI